VRDEDRGAVGVELLEQPDDALRLGARVDDDRLARLGVGADDVAVRPDRAELEAVDR
jgi:hypothetical protein